MKRNTLVSFLISFNIFLSFLPFNISLVVWYIILLYSDSSLVLIKDCLCNTTIINVNYSDWNELILELSSGYIFRSFQSYGEDAENFQLCIQKKRFLVYPNKVELENLHQFYKG